MRETLSSVLPVGQNCELMQFMLLNFVPSVELLCKKKQMRSSPTVLSQASYFCAPEESLGLEENGILILISLSLSVSVYLLSAYLSLSLMDKVLLIFSVNRKQTDPQN